MNNDDLLPLFKTQLKSLAPDAVQFKVALSGGLDSIVLLHLFSRLVNEKVCAHHIHHGLSENADSWALFCMEKANELSINCEVSRTTLARKNRISLEALAREKRYTLLKEGLTETTYLVTAHHQDDQLETILLALKRGAGLTGLQGIVAKQTLEIGYLIRPLLDFSREQLESYASRFQLKWIEDESNTDQQFDRNFIRHSITPLLKKRWPAITKTVARSASHCQTQQSLIDAITEEDFYSCADSSLVLNINILEQLSDARRANVLRYWFKTTGLTYPSSNQLREVWLNIALAQADAEPRLMLQGYVVTRYRGGLYLFDEKALIQPLKKQIWQGESNIRLECGKSVLQVAVSQNFPTKSHIVEICFRKDLPQGLMCQPIGREKSRSIKKLLHEYNVPPWLRDSVPFILIDGILIEAVGVWRCETIFSESFHTTWC